MGFLQHLFHRQPPTTEHDMAQQVVGQQVMESFEQYYPLMRLQDERQFLEVFLPGEQYSVHSMIIGIDFATGTFSLDEFSPAIAQPEALIEENLVIRHYQDWQKLEITSSVLDWDADNAQYTMLLPEYVGYQARRLYPRLVLSGKQLLKSQIYPIYGSPWYATVKDISRGGMRINVAGDLRPHLQKNTVLPKCQLLLDNNMTIQCQGSVKGFRYVSRPSRTTEIGIEFRQMSPDNQTDLKRFLEYIEVAA